MSAGAQNPNQELCIAARGGDTDEVLRLLGGDGEDGHAANPNAVFDPEKNITVLMLAAEHGSAAMVHALLDAGASWQERSLDGATPGEYAMANTKDRECFKLLLEWAVQCEMILGASSLKQREEEESRHISSNEEYLSSSIKYTDDGDIIDESSGDAVMMTWETPLMERHAKDICWKGPGEGVVLNIGFGMGIIDRFIQRENPKQHVIIEAHPDVYKQMIRLGWDKKPNVKVVCIQDHEIFDTARLGRSLVLPDSLTLVFTLARKVFGRWQDVIDELGLTVKFDGVFFDTYGEYWEDMVTLHRRLPSIMNEGGVYSFFNGLSPDNIFFHLVAGEVARRELNELGFSVSYSPVKVDTVDSTTWNEVEKMGSGRKYWHFDQYFLPVCVLAGRAARPAPSSS
jgi:protein arginine N-methyltransferase 2